MTDKTKEELIEEINIVNKRIAEFEKLYNELGQQHRNIKRYEAVVRDSNDAIIIQGLDGRITAWNRGAEQIYGYSEKEALGMNIDDLSSPAKVAEFKEFTRRLIAGEAVSSFETQRLTKDGKILDIWVTVTKISEYPSDSIISTNRDITNPVGIASIERNISARKRAEEERDRLLNTTRDLICIAGMDGRFKYTNPAWETTLGYSAQELQSKPFLAFIHPDDHHKNDLEVARLASGLPSIDFENRYIHKDGSIHTISWSASSIPERGEMYCVGRDITERKAMEEEARIAKTNLSYLTKYANDFIILLDDKFRFLETNERVIDTYGYTREELFGMHATDLRAPETKALFEEQIKPALVKGKALYETVHQHKNGMKFPVEISLRAINAGDKRLYQAIIRDITERKGAEESLRQSEIKLRNIMDNIGIGIALISPDMEILSLNNQMKKWNPRVDPGERPICYRAFNNPPSKEICSYCPTAKTLKDGLVHEDVTETPMGGQVFNYRIVSSAIKDRTGKIVAAIEMVEDITARKRLEKDKQKHLDELEVFYKASLGREERILELKNEIERLKQKPVK